MLTSVPVAWQALTVARTFKACLHFEGMALEACEDIVTPGGVIANIGVHGVKADLHLERLWDRNIAITTRLVDTVTVRPPAVDHPSIQIR
jgi:threonine dehydrogenase-like Zn-dependent dehydrogenase